MALAAGAGAPPLPEALVAPEVRWAALEVRWAALEVPAPRVPRMSAAVRMPAAVPRRAALPAEVREVPLASAWRAPRTAVVLRKRVPHRVIRQAAHRAGQA